MLVRARAESEMQHEVDQVIHRQQPGQCAGFPAAGSTLKAVLLRS